MGVHGLGGTPCGIQEKLLNISTHEWPMKMCQKFHKKTIKESKDREKKIRMRDREEEQGSYLNPVLETFE